VGESAGRALTAGGAEGSGARRSRETTATTRPPASAASLNRQPLR
jgi:hypothetical protein